MGMHLVQQGTMEWLKLRQTGIGASDAAAVLGWSEYDTPRDVFYNKIDPNVGIESERSESGPSEWGTRLEDLVAQAYVDRIRKIEMDDSFRVQRDNKIRFLDSLPIVMASLDRIVVREGGHERLLECKTTSGFAAPRWFNDEGEMDLPMDVYCQVQHQMLATGFKRVDVALLVLDTRQFYIKSVYADPELHKWMLEVYPKFWELVESMEPPTPSTIAEWKVITPTEGKEHQATPELVDTWTELLDVRADLKRLEERKEALTDVLRLAMEDAEVLRYGDTVMATWKQSTPTRFDATAFQHKFPDLAVKYMVTNVQRTFLVKEPKKAKGKG